MERRFAKQAHRWSKGAGWQIKGHASERRVTLIVWEGEAPADPTCGYAVAPPS